MEHIIISTCHVVLLIILILTVDQGAESIFCADLICFIAILIYLLIQYKNKYIPIKIVLFWVLCVIMQLLGMIVIGFKPDSGPFGLGPGRLATGFHFVFNILYPIIFIIINIIKWCKNMFIKMIEKSKNK